MNDYQKRSHSIGRISLLVAIALFISYPLATSLIFGAYPDMTVVLKGLLAIVPIYWTVGAIEAFTFGPMLGTGAYLGFVTGNLSAMKVPVSLMAIELTEVKANSEAGDVVATIAIAICSIVTVLIIILGMVLISFIQPILSSPILAPAFENILPALFGALGVFFMAKRIKIAIFPIVFMTVLFLALPQLSSAVSLLVPLSAALTVGIARILYKKNWL